MQPGQALVCDLEFDAARGIGLDQIHEVPRNDARRDFVEQQVQRLPWNYTFQQAPHRASRAHVHFGNLQDEVIVAALLLHVDVVHANDFASVDIDNLLVEQVVLEHQHAFRTYERLPIRRLATSAYQPAVDPDQRLRRDQSLAGGGLHHQRGYHCGLRPRCDRHLANTPADLAGFIGNLRAQQLRQ